MKILKKYMCFTLIALIFISFIPTKTALAYQEIKDSSSFIVLDSDSKKSLPERFREIKSLKISGSSQFTPLQIPNIKSTINSPKLFIVDLRQESHGFINDIAISFYNKYYNLNNGFRASETLAAEKKALSSIKLDKPTVIYSKTTRPLFNVLVQSVFDEANVLRDNNISYVRLAVKDGSIPSPEIVDQFVATVKYQVEDSHIHFHCEAGEERTTTFLSMYQMMKNKKHLSLEEILDYNVSIGGIVLTDNNDRCEFLHEFYRYSQENMKNNFRVPYSKWIQSHSSKYDEITQ